MDVIKVMMECDMACTLMNAIQRIMLEHSLAAAVAANLLKPLEIFTRRTVVDAIQALADKEKNRSDLNHSVLMTEGKNNHETPENALLDAGFDPDHISEGENYDGLLLDDDDESTSTGIDDDSETSDDIIMMEASEEDLEDEYISDGEIESESESDESEEDSLDDSNDIMESYDEEDLIEVDHNEFNSDEDSIADENEDVNDGEDDENNIEAYGYDVEEEDENHDFFEDDEDVRDEEIADAEDEEDWTNVDRGAGFGFDSLFSTTRIAHPVGRPRAPTGMIEAAASVLGNILQSGEIPIQALERLQQIGLPVSTDVHRMHFVPRHTRDAVMMNRVPVESNELDSIPVIHQLSPPDNGFSHSNSTVRGSDINFMEYLYGGLVIGASRVYYELVSDSDGTNDMNQQLLSVPSVMETELFPGGPAANTTPKMSETTHILLSGVCLPPLNALISTTCRNEDGGLHRPRSLSSDPFGGWQEIFSGSGGNIIRLGRFADRSGQNSSNGNANTEGNEAMETEGASAFSLAFERTLTGFTSQARNLNQEDANEIGVPSHDDISDFINRVVAANSQGSASIEDSNQNDTNSNLEVSESNVHDRGREPANDTSLEIQRQDLAIQDSTVSVNPSNRDNAVEPMDLASTENVEASEDLNMTSTSEIVRENNDSNLQVATNGNETAVGNTTSENNLVCPPGMDQDVFAQLPFEMQHEIVQEHEATSALTSQLVESSSLDPEALAALPEEVRLEVLAQERHNRANQEASEPADPSRAEEMDPASFIASLAPDLRQEILMTADDDFLNSLPPDIRTEAEVIRERALLSRGAIASTSQSRERPRQNRPDVSTRRSSKKKHKSQPRVDCNRSAVIYLPPNAEAATGQLVSPQTLKSLIDLMFLLSPVRPQRLLQKLFLNLCYHPDIRKILAIVFIALLNDEPGYAIEALKGLGISSGLDMSFSKSLIGPPPESFAGESDVTNYFSNNHVTRAASAIALNLPISSRVSLNDGECLPPVVSKRLIGTLLSLTKGGTRMPVDILSNFDCNNENHDSKNTCLDTILSLMAKPTYSKSASSLEELLGVIDNICFPLEYVFNDHDSVVDPSDKDIEAAAASGKEYVIVPRATVDPKMLKLLCSILLLDSCQDALFGKFSSILRRLSRVEENRKCILDELALVAQELGTASVRDLRSLKIQLELAAQNHRTQLKMQLSDIDELDDKTDLKPGTASSAVTLSTTSTDLKLLRVLQTLFSLCNSSQENNEVKRDDTRSVSHELLSILQKIELDNVWEQLTSCLNVVSFLEGVDTLTKESDDEKKESDDDADEDDLSGGKKLQNSVAGLLTRFLPSIEAFFIVNACVIERENNDDESSVNAEERLAGGDKVLKFVSVNKVLLNALLRSIPSLLDKGLRALVQIPKCCVYLDFDVKRHWFKQQVRKLRAQASRRHGSLRLNIRRPYVFEDAYRQLNLRTADEMRGRLHVTFVNEEGVDAGGLSREFFGILAKEIFNPNYALFTSTEDGCTFQPNPLSSINRDHLDYFRFVGRIVGKAVADGFLLDAHFTRSLYKHMLGMKPTYHDMQAIDPDYYKNLKMILDYNLEDIGLDLTFSTVTYWFGRAQTVDLIPNGRNIPVTESDKEKYVDLVCQHRMTTSIEKQVDAFLHGFYDLVKPELISVFNPRELELIISGMPDIDILDLKKNTDYHGWKPADKEITWFWNILFSLSKSDKAAFLQFVTGSSKVPLNGFSELQGMRGIQKFSIHKASGSEGALMSAHTCFNSLDLPTYKNEDEMREKLMYAIKEGASGFLFA